MCEKRLQLASGRVLEAEESDGAEIVRVRGRTGRVEIAIELTEHGPRLIVEAADLELRATRSVTVSCEDFALQASGSAALRGADVSIDASTGDLRMTANDAVDLKGEQILLNSDRPQAPPPWMGERLEARMADSIPLAPRRDAEGILAQRSGGADRAEEPEDHDGTHERGSRT